MKKKTFFDFFLAKSISGFRCVPNDAPYEIYLASVIDVVIDICNFGLVKFNFSIDETFDRQVSELCIDVISSDDAARTDPSTIHDVAPFTNYQVSHRVR